MASEGYAQPRFKYADDVARALQWIDDKLVARGELQARCQFEAVERLEHLLALTTAGRKPAQDPAMPAKSLVRPSGPLKPKPVATRYLTLVTFPWVQL